MGRYPLQENLPKNGCNTVKDIATEIHKPLSVFNCGIAEDFGVYDCNKSQSHCTQPSRLYPACTHQRASGSGSGSPLAPSPECAGGGGGGATPAAGRACEPVPGVGHDRPGPSMLDNNSTYQEVKKKAWNDLTPFQKRLKAKRGRYYHCLASGMRWHKNDEQYFLTLTSSPDSQSLYKSFNHFVKLVRMATPNSLVKGDYMSRNDALKWFQKGDLDKCLRFEYCKLQTSEGCGVLHIVFAGSRIPIKFIRAIWSHIHDAKQIVIKHIQKEDADGNKRLKNYLMKQYLYGQDGFIRYSCSDDWIYPGYRGDWVYMYKLMGYREARVRWDACMELHRKPGQTDFYGEQVYTPSELSRFRKNRRGVENGKR